MQRLILVLLVVACSHGYSDWRTVKSEHFVVHTALRAATASKVLGASEAIHGALQQGFFYNSALAPIEVLLFEDPEAERQAIAKASAGAAPPRIRDKALVLHDRPDYRFAKAVSQYSTNYEQEAAAYLSRRFIKENMPKAPLWFRVGMEQYLETVEIQGDLARYGHRLPRPTAELAAGRVIELGAMIAAPPSEFSGNGDFRRSHTATAWAFIHYLVGGEKGTHRPQFDIMARGLIDAGRGSAEASRAAIEKAFPNLPFEQLAGKFKDYAVLDLGKRPFVDTYAYRFQRAPDREYPSTPADPVRIQALLVHLKRGD